MVIGVDDVLIACATAAGKALGEELGKELFQAVFGKLATKADIDRAVQALEQYVHEQIVDLENDLLCVNVTTAIGQLSDYTQDNDQQQLGFAYNSLSQARAWIDGQRAKLGDDFLRQQYVAVVQYVTADLALWVNYALSIDPKKYTPTACGKIDDHVILLNQAVTQIKLMETESVTSIQTGARVVHTPDGPGPVQPFGLEPYVEGSYTLVKKTYPNGSILKTTGWINTGDPNVAVSAITGQWNADVARAALENQKRSDLVYTPVATYCATMGSLKGRLQTALANMP